jgi:hypothetical protein
VELNREEVGKGDKLNFQSRWSKVNKLNEKWNREMRWRKKKMELAHEKHNYLTSDTL